MTPRYPEWTLFDPAVYGLLWGAVFPNGVRARVRPTGSIFEWYLSSEGSPFAMGNAQTAEEAMAQAERRARHDYTKSQLDQNTLYWFSSNVDCQRWDPVPLFWVSHQGLYGPQNQIALASWLTSTIEPFHVSIAGWGIFMVRSQSDGLTIAAAILAWINDKADWPVESDFILKRLGHLHPPVSYTIQHPPTNKP